MPHESGRVLQSQTGAAFVPDRVPQGIDCRGGFILLKEERTSPNAKDSAINPIYLFYPVERISFDYLEIERGGETKAGYYYGVKNIRKEA